MPSGINNLPGTRAQSWLSGRIGGLHPISPLLGIYAALTRRSLDGKHPGGWVPEQRVSVTEAVHAYTVVPAYASGEEAIKGSLEPGKLADVVILSDDVFPVDPVSIERVQVLMTIFDGKVIHQRQQLGAQEGGEEFQNA
ncbi:MAG: amidohydrolase family protein [Terriglobales bacterium]